MLYFSLEAPILKCMYVKRGLLGQYETSFYQKTFPDGLTLTPSGFSVDLAAATLKDALSMLGETPIKDREATLILSGEMIQYTRVTIPVDITEEIRDSYIREKTCADLNVTTESHHVAWDMAEHEGVRIARSYALDKSLYEKIKQSCGLVGLTLSGVVPAALAEFTLFQKTLRANKKEHVWFVRLENEHAIGHAFDSLGPLDGTEWIAPTTEKTTIKVLQKKVAEYQAAETTFNRLILSGLESDGIRQDTFTKQVGVWTNPLKRIVPHFYAEYLKMLAGQDNRDIPVLGYDRPIGAFIMQVEKNMLSFVSTGKKKENNGTSGKKVRLPLGSIPPRGIALFFMSFGITFGLLFAASRLNLVKGPGSISLPSVRMPQISLVNPLSRPSPTPEASPTPIPPTPTPTPSVDRASVRVRVLNGSGIAGKATKVKTFLNEKGYEEILTGNAARFDYTATVIQTKEGKENLGTVIAEDIASEITEQPEFSTLPANDPADIVLIFGKDFR